MNTTHLFSEKFHTNEAPVAKAKDRASGKLRMSRLRAITPALTPKAAMWVRVNSIADRPIEVVDLNVQERFQKKLLIIPTT